MNAADAYEKGGSRDDRERPWKFCWLLGGLQLPMCLAGAGACPPEDIGGATGYADFFQAIADPAHQGHVEMTEWIGRLFDADAFDVQEAQDQLYEIRL